MNFLPDIQSSLLWYCERYVSDEPWFLDMTWVNLEISKQHENKPIEFVRENLGLGNMPAKIPMAMPLPKLKIILSVVSIIWWHIKQKITNNFCLSRKKTISGVQ